MEVNPEYIKEIKDLIDKQREQNAILMQFLKDQAMLSVSDEELRKEDILYQEAFKNHISVSMGIAKGARDLARRARDLLRSVGELE